jgi:hypothetical protein
MKTKLVIAAIIGSIAGAYADESQDLTILRDSYLRARERALSPIQEKYITELNSLKGRFTKNGKLDEAVEVDKELKLALETFAKKTDEKPKAEKPSDTPEHLFGEWVCNGVETDIYVIKRTKKAFHGGSTATWQVTGQLLTISWDNGFQLTIDTTQASSEIIGKSYPPNRSTPDVLMFTKKK